MTRDELSALELLAFSAVKGPWEAVDNYVHAPNAKTNDNDTVLEVFGPISDSESLAATAAFVAAVRESVPRLIHLLRESDAYAQKCQREMLEATKAEDRAKEEASELRLKVSELQQEIERIHQNEAATRSFWESREKMRAAERDEARDAVIALYGAACPNWAGIFYDVPALCANVVRSRKEAERVAYEQGFADMREKAKEVTYSKTLADRDTGDEITRIRKQLNADIGKCVPFEGRAEVVL